MRSVTYGISHIHTVFDSLWSGPNTVQELGVLIDARDVL